MAARHRELAGHVKAMFDSSDGIFGHRMVHTKLTAAGVEVSVGTVAAIMAENGWAAKGMRAFKRTTIPSDSDKGLRGPYRALPSHQKLVP
ncbi:IS3 family transposase [Arthrobacter sp. HLT1-21]